MNVIVYGASASSRARSSSGRRRGRLRGGLEPTNGTHVLATEIASALPADAGVGRGGGTGALDESARAEIEREWKTRVRKLPLKQRREWLEKQAVRVLMRAPSHESRLDAVEHEEAKLRETVPSSTWFDDAAAGATFPEAGMTLCDARVLLEHAPNAPGSIVPYSGELYAGRRWCSPLAATVEDELDEMDVLRATRYRFPASCSAVAIQRIEVLRATESKGRRKRHQRRLVPMWLTRADGRVCVGFC